MTGDKGMVFDANCGIPEEEQREIFAQINRIAEKNRLSLAASADVGKVKKTKPFIAKKSGSLFPVLVNAAAIAMLAGGFLALYIFQGRTDVDIREGAKLYNSAERALIEEIVSDSARSELDRLSREQAHAAAVEAQMAAFFANVSRAVNENNLDEASRIIRSMRDFLNTPAFQGLRSIQARKDLYAQAITSFETLVDELRRSQAALASGILSLDRSAEEMFTQLQERSAQLERDLADRDRRITEIERTLQTTTAARDSATQNVATLERRVETLQTQNATLQTNVNQTTQRANTLQDTVAARDSTIRNQNATIGNRDACIQQIQQVIQGRALADMTFNELSDSLTRIQGALQSLN